MKWWFFDLDCGHDCKYYQNKIIPQLWPTYTSYTRWMCIQFHLKLHSFYTDLETVRSGAYIECTTLIYFIIITNAVCSKTMWIQHDFTTVNPSKLTDINHWYKQCMTYWWHKLQHLQYYFINIWCSICIDLEQTNKQANQPKLIWLDWINSWSTIWFNWNFNQMIIFMQKGRAKEWNSVQTWKISSIRLTLEKLVDVSFVLMLSVNIKTEVCSGRVVLSAETRYFTDFGSMLDIIKHIFKGVLDLHFSWRFFYDFFIDVRIWPQFYLGIYLWKYIHINFNFKEN